MRSKLTAVAVGLLLLPLSGAGAQEGEAAAPWFLKFSHGPLDVITIPFRDGSSQTFYYMTFEVENGSTVDALLGLHIRAVVTTDGGKKSRTHFASPSPDAEEAIRRITRAADLKNVQEINKHNAAQAQGVLKPGEKLRGVAVLGTFDREWDTAVLTVSGLEPRAIHCRARKFGDGFTLAHRAYREHNDRVRKAAPEDSGTDVYAIVQHDVHWKMTWLREGDEFEPQMDFSGRVVLEGEGWTVSEDPAPRIVLEKKPPFGKPS